jgi:hypothetical protein
MTPTRKIGLLIAIAATLITKPSRAQPPSVTLSLTPVEAAALQSELDRQPPEETPPVGYWDLKEKFVSSVEADPKFKHEVVRLLPGKKHSCVGCE